MKKLFLLFIPIMIFLGCEKKDGFNDIMPRASFSVDILNPKAGDVVRFKSTSVRAEHLEWYINGVLQKRNTEMFAYHFKQPGKYIVTLIAYSKNNTKKSTYSEEIRISKNENNIDETKVPTALFTVSPLQPYVNQTVILSNNSLNASSYIWQIDNKTIRSNKSEIFHIFNTSGSHTIVLTAYNSDKSKNNTISKTIIVKPEPTRLKIIAITINSISFVDNNGRYWDDDNDDYPDIYINLYDKNKLLFNPNTYFKNVSLFPLTMKYNQVISTNKDYKFEMYDYDKWKDDWMARFNFNSKNYSNYPNKVTLSAGKYEIVLHIEYLD